MTRNVWLGLSLVTALGLGAALAQDRPQERGGQTGKTGQTGKLDENQVKQVLQQKEYLKGLNITPRVEGDVVTLEGTVPSKAHVIAALTAVFELPSIKFVNSKLNFNESMLGMGATGGASGEGTSGERGHEGTTLGAGMGQSQDLEVVVAIFPAAKAQQYGTTVPAGMHERLTDVIIFKKGNQ
jgi:hypothetical protein